MTFENGKLVQKQTWDGKTTTLERELQDGKLIAVRLMSCLLFPFSAWFDIKYAFFISLFWNMSMLDIAILFNVACDHHDAIHVVILQIGFSRGYQQGWHAFLRANVFKMSFIVLAGKRGLISTCSHVQHAT